MQQCVAIYGHFVSGRWRANRVLFLLFLSFSLFSFAKSKIDPPRRTKTCSNSARIAVFLLAVAARGPCYEERRSPHKSPSLKAKLEICLWTHGGRTLNNGARLHFVHGTARLRRGKTLRCAQQRMCRDDASNTAPPSADSPNSMQLSRTWRFEGI